MKSIYLKLRQKTAQALDEAGNSDLNRFVKWLIVTLIILSVTAVILESDSRIYHAYQGLFVGIEYVTIFIFSVEYLSRVWSAPDILEYQHLSPFKARLRYIFSFYALIDLLAILPFFLIFTQLDFRYVRIIRLVRILKLTRYSNAFNMLTTVLRREARSFYTVVFLLLITLIFSASTMYLIEREYQPEAFGSIPKSMWWAIVTLATVGYGEVIPHTPLGQLISGIIMIIGIGLVALPAGVLASAFSEQLHKNRSNYQKAVLKAMANGEINEHERAVLRQLQITYDISDEEANEILRWIISGHQQNKAPMIKTSAAALATNSQEKCLCCGQPLPAETTNNAATDNNDK